MRVTRNDNDDTVRFENLNPGDTFQLPGDPALYLRATDGKRGWPAVNLETGDIREFNPTDKVRPAKTRAVIDEVGRVACGFNAR